MLGIAAALVALALTAARPAEARRLFVPKGYRTIQKAIDAASPGDTVWVASGVYKTGTIFLRKQLVLFGEGGPDSTILDGGDSTRVLHIEGVKGATVLGFQFRNGKAPAGGGIYCLRDSSVMIASCRIEQNWEGGLQAWQCGDMNFRELRFVGNQGSAIVLNETSAVIMMSWFEKNAGYAGGAVSLVHSKIMFPMRQCTFEGNTAEATGGAINADSSDGLMSECYFHDNSSGVAGGAVALMSGTDFAISRCRFSGNHSKTGGALHADHAKANVAFTVFDKNKSIALGAAIGMVGTALRNVNPFVMNNAFYKNESVEEGASVFCEKVSPEIRKNIFVIVGDQKAVGGIESSPLFDCNLLFDPTGQGLASLPSANTLVGDPLFCDPEHDDFYLRDLSPAVLAPCGPIGPLPKRCTSFKMVPGR
jgi:predicted outer membrane repeat protein